MQNRFVRQMQTLAETPENRRFLLAVSGGRDSMVMAELFFRSGWKFALAHANFGLRGSESDSDEAFVMQWCQQRGIHFFSKKFETESYAEENGLSIQMAARKLRYGWFDEIAESEGFDLICTAHHAGDNAETVLIGLLRGAGLESLDGIPEKNGKIIRPLLFASREEISNWAIEQNIPWREDSSNAKDEYLRNAIRNRVLPAMEASVPDAGKHINSSAGHLRAYNRLFARMADLLLQSHLTFSNGKEMLDTGFLQEFPHPELLVYHWLKKHGFSISQLKPWLENPPQTGSQLRAGNMTLWQDRGKLILTSDQGNPYDFFVQIGTEPDTAAFTPWGRFTVEEQETYQPNPHTLALPENLSTLIIRNRENGDRMQPAGMTGHKKISDILVDSKLSVPAKDLHPMVCSGDEILWLAGIRKSAAASAAETLAPVKILRWTPHPS